MKIATRSRSNVFATAVKGHTMGTERMVVPTIAQAENLSSASCTKLPFAIKPDFGIVCFDFMWISKPDFGIMY